MRYRLGLVLAVGLPLLTLAAFAHASPPDQTWQPGVYDDGDFDDVIDLIGTLSGAPPDTAPAISARAVTTSAVLIGVEPGDLPPRRLRADDTRGPPVLLKHA